MLWASAVVGLAAAVAVAILRHRLFDIDRIVSRTLVYGLLTAALGLVYGAGVFAGGRVLDRVTGAAARARRAGAPR